MRRTQPITAGSADGRRGHEPRNVGGLQKQEKTRKVGSPLEPPESNATLPIPRSQPSDTMSGFWPLAVPDNEFVLFEPLSLWQCVLAAIEKERSNHPNSLSHSVKPSATAYVGSAWFSSLNPRCRQSFAYHSLTIPASLTSASV